MQKRESDMPGQMITKEDFGLSADGVPVYLFTLNNDNGMQARITNYGGALQSLLTEDKNGRFEDVVLGYDSLKDYEADQFYIGGIIGRHANRIAGGKFILNGGFYRLPINNGPNHLHGGIKGFNKVVWDVGAIDEEKAQLTMHYLSGDGEEGYPGYLDVEVTFTLTEDNALGIDYLAVTDQPTVCNLTHHDYFNLSGNFRTNILDHLLWIHADRFTPLNENHIPTGEIVPVKNTPLDFTVPKVIGEHIETDDLQLKQGQGYDHNLCLNDYDGALRWQASLHDPRSGRILRLYTSAPGVQLYSGNFLDGSARGKGGKYYAKHDGLCLETQHYPDAPNQPGFPSTVLNPGQVYQSTTVYEFAVKEQTNDD